jgi:hypothetical protein
LIEWRFTYGVSRHTCLPSAQAGLLGGVKMKPIYYSHSMRSYNTDQERLELTQIASFFPKRKILNPNGAITDMNQAYRLINKAEIVVATEYQSHIGKGVYDEICYALSRKKFVAMLRNGHLFRVYSEHQIEVVDIDWQVHYAKVYEGFVIPPLQERLTVERIRAKKLSRESGLNDIASTTKEFLIAVGRIQVLSELLGERVKERL